ncbi:MAG: glycosyltransferase [Sinomonas sp.]|nr:glycosyltransferase [Sinomonas sp.]
MTMGHTITTRRARVAIVQPYVPTYRVAFFEGLREVLGQQGIELTVIADDPDGEQSGRGDAVQLPWIQHFKQQRVAMGRRSIRFGTAHKHWKACDAVIVGHLGSSLDTNLALALSALGNIKVGVWGHIDSSVGEANALDSLVERWQLRRAGHVFAYTPGGARLAKAVGADAERVTTVMNTIDTGALEAAVAEVDDPSVRELLGGADLDPVKTFSFIGGLDASKRIDFLAEALDRLWTLDPSIKLLVAGRGEDEGLLQRSVDRGQTTMLGYAEARLKAALGLATRGILMPGRIGLIAVDALVLGLPVLSTQWPFHAPEAEYLTPGESLLQSADSADAYADLIYEESCREELRYIPRDYPRLDGMIANFANGILSLLAR